MNFSEDFRRRPSVLRCGFFAHRRSTMGRWLISLVIVTGLIGLATGGAALKESPALLTIGILPDVDSLPLVLALEAGLFEGAKLHVELVPFKSALERDTAIQTGKIDGGISDILAATFAQNAGFAVEIVSHTDGRYRLLAAPSSQMGNIHGLQGKAIGISPNTIIEYATDMMLQDAGMDSDSVDKVSILDIPLRLQLLLGGQLTAACLPDPLAALAASKGAIPIADSQDMQLAPGVLVFSSRALGAKADTIRRLLAVYNEAIALLNANSTDMAFLEPLLDKAGFPAGVVQAMELPVYRPAALPTRTEVDTVLAWLQEKELLQHTVTYEDLTAEEPWQVK